MFDVERDTNNTFVSGFICDDRMLTLTLNEDLLEELNMSLLKHFPAYDHIDCNSDRLWRAFVYI
jgi:hypothetical protein